MNPSPSARSRSGFRPRRVVRLAALLLACAFAGGCATEKKDTVDYGFGMQFQQTPP